MSKHQHEIFETDHLRDDLGGRSVRGVAITLGAQGLKFLLQTTSTIVLARLLLPEDFGLVAMVMVVVGLASVFKDMGFSWATVQSPRITHEQISTLFWINLIIAVVLTVALIIASPYVAEVYDEPRLVPIGMALSLTFLFYGLSAQHIALLRRQMRYGTIAIIELISMGLAISAGILIASKGGMYWALVAVQLVTAIAAAFFAWLLSPWKPGLPRRRSGIRNMVLFGGYLTGFTFLNYFTRQVDNALIGYFAGATQLGLYSKAYNLFQMPMRQMNAPLTSVALPTLSRLQEDPVAYRGHYLRAVQGLAYLSIPTVALAAGIADPLIPFVLGAQWAEAVPIFQLLALGGLVTPILWTAGWIHQSRGRTDRMLRWSLVSDPVYVLSFAIGVRWGAIGVAAGFAIALHVLWLPTLAYAYRGTELRVLSLLKNIYPAMVFGLVAFLTSFLVTSTLDFADASVLLLAVLAVLASAGLLFTAWPQFRREVRALVELRAHLKR